MTFIIIVICMIITIISTGMTTGHRAELWLLRVNG